MIAEAEASLASQTHLYGLLLEHGRASVASRKARYSLLVTRKYIKCCADLWLGASSRPEHTSNILLFLSTFVIFLHSLLGPASRLPVWALFQCHRGDS